LNIRSIEFRDVEEILAIQAECREIAQWCAQDYEAAAQGEMCGWVCDNLGALAGFLVARRVACDLEILNFAVRPGERQKGIGSSLLRKAIDWGEMFGAEQVFLEVRSSNAVALDFYKARNFQKTGDRPRYYRNPTDSALLLSAPVSIFRW